VKNKYQIIAILFLFISSIQASAQNSIVGKWKTIDDETGEAKSVVEIYKNDDQYFGQIIKLFPGASEEPDPICNKCPMDDSRYNKKVIGMEILKNVKRDGEEYVDGTVLKPDEGKIYKCKLWIENDNLLIRGYWGFFYRTQIWVKYN
jgi:uncharacterized protein (DUF2147 family)